MKFLAGEQIYLRKLSIEDVTNKYLDWMNDYKITKFTESRFYPMDLNQLEKFVHNSNNATNITFAIIDNISNAHIGNIKLGDINWIHRFADIGLIIGEKEFWGKGIATEAIKLVTHYGIHMLNSNKIYAGVYEPNVGSRRAFEKAGYSIGCTFKEKYFLEGNYVDSFMMEFDAK